MATTSRSAYCFESSEKSMDIEKYSLNSKFSKTHTNQISNDSTQVRKEKATQMSLTKTNITHAPDSS
jgi:hypothetical protein